MQNYEKRHVFLMYAIGTLILIPLYILVGPFLFQSVLFDSKSVWLIQTPSHTYWLYGISGAVLALFLFLAYLFGRFSGWFTSLGVIGALALFALGTFSYQSLSTEKIAWSELGAFQSEVYTWEEVEQVILVLPKAKEKHKMVFHFKDGNEVTFIRDNKFTTQFSYFNGLRRQYDFPFTVDRTNALK